MPFQSEKQRRFLHANHPEIAKRWEKEYSHGGILDINESEEIIDDGGNEIALTDYNAAFDDPNDLSTGVKSLFRAKDGGRIGLYQGGGPHAGGYGTTSSSSGDKGGYKNVHQTGAVTQTPGRTTTPTSTGGDGVYQDQIMKIAEQQKKTKETRETASKQGWHQFITPRHVTPTPKEKSFLDKLGWGIAIYTGIAPLLGLKVPSFVSSTGKLLSTKKDIEKGVALVNKMFNTNYDVDELIDKQVEKFKERKEKMDLYNSLPDGHPEKIALSIELEIGKKPDHLGDDGGSLDLPQVVPIGEEIEEYTSVAPDAGATLAAIRSKQALRSMINPDWQLTAEKREEKNNPIFMTANNGGLANLFRVKNQ